MVFSVHFLWGGENKIIKKDLTIVCDFLRFQFGCTTMASWPLSLSGENEVMMEAADQAHFWGAIVISLLSLQVMAARLMTPAA